MTTTTARTRPTTVNGVDELFRAPTPPQGQPWTPQPPRTPNRGGNARGERVVITGSRERTDRQTIEAVIADLPADTTIITGGCEGPDQWAEAAARRRGLQVETYFPDLPISGPGYLFTRAYYRRNCALVEACDRLIAFPIGPRGGTWHTIGQAVLAGKRIEIIPPPCPTARSERTR